MACDRKRKFDDSATDRLLDALRVQPCSLADLLGCAEPDFDLRLALETMKSRGDIGVRLCGGVECFFVAAASQNRGARREMAGTPVKHRLPGPPIVFKNAPVKKSPLKGGFVSPVRTAAAAAAASSSSSSSSLSKHASPPPPPTLPPRSPRAGGRPASPLIAVKIAPSVESTSNDGDDLASLEAEDERLSAAIEQLKRSTADQTPKALEHIEALHVYNDVKDAGQVILGQLAIFEGTTTRKLYPRFGLSEDD